MPKISTLFIFLLLYSANLKRFNVNVDKQTYLNGGLANLKAQSAALD